MKTNIDKIAETCHEANRVYCESVGDFSQAYWMNSPEWQKKSAVAGVQHFLANPDVTSEQMHENWMRDKWADGWKYGAVKDVDKKEHPCMVPYDKLPKEQQFKDKLFRGIVALFINK